MGAVMVEDLLLALVDLLVEVVGDTALEVVDTVVEPVSYYWTHYLWSCSKRHEGAAARIRGTRTKGKGSKPARSGTGGSWSRRRRGARDEKQGGRPTEWPRRRTGRRRQGT